MVWKFFGLGPSDAMSKVLDRARGFCGRSWGDIKGSELGGSVNLERYCLWGPYAVMLLQEGLKIEQGWLRIGEGGGESYLCVLGGWRTLR